VGERVVGRRGYHAGEELHVVRRPDGWVSHLEVATFVYTRTPYDPDVTIPGGHPHTQG
jgi:D-alanyl-D-alanine carboxypeptidase